MSRTAAIVFDLDGTLVDSAPDIAAALNRTLAESGLPPLPGAVVRDLTGFGSDELVRRAFAAREVTLAPPELGRQTRRYLDEYGRHPADRTEVFEDARVALPELRRRGVRLAVCTNKETALARTVLRAMGLDGVVQAVVGADAVARRKPDPEHLRAALDAVGTRPDEALYVGDTAVDAKTAGAAGVRCALVAWGDGRDAGCVRIDRFADLLDLAGRGAARV